MAISFKRNGTRYDKSHQDRVRQKIADSHVANKLIAFFNGELSLTKEQASVGMALLRKIVPDLASSEVTLDTVQPFAVLPNEIKDIAEWEQAANPDSDTKH